MNPRRILVADDEPNMSRVLKLQLERAGYLVRTANDGKEALDAILESAPDVLVTDIQMPRMSGEQLCAAIEKQVPGRKFPIFVMTSMTDREHRHWTHNMRDTHFLEKPISVRMLITKVEERFARGPEDGEASDV
jgi:CheY-like chemotaxis protein